MKNISSLAVALALILQLQTIQARNLVGRDALNEARAHIDGGNTYTSYEKPSRNVVVVRDHDADTHETLFAVELVDDQKAEEHYARYFAAESENETVEVRSPDEQSVNLDSALGLFERASRCGQFCSRSADCSNNSCPQCQHARRRPGSTGNTWQKQCKPRV